MSLYPYELDDDTTIIRVDDNISEISGQNFNQVRDAVFRIEDELGVKPSGSMDSLKELLGVSLNSNGTIKNSALAAVGLVTLPIDNSMIGINAGIWESKLQLDFTTSDLRQMISQNSDAVNAINAVVGNLIVDLNGHIGGSPDITLRHVASHIDLNSTPSDSRDPLFNWSGLLDKNGDQRTATNVASALLQINDELVEHENQISSAHSAESISVDTSEFVQISRNSSNVQLALEDLDAVEDRRIGLHRARMHSGGVPSQARSEVIKKFDRYFDAITPDGYGSTIVNSNLVETFVSVFPGTGPVDNVNTGDNIIKFIPPTDPAEKLVFESEFSQVKAGDIIRVIYGDGYNVETQYYIDSVRYIPDSSYYVRVDSNNLIETTDAYARIDSPLYDPNIYSIGFVAPSNPELSGGLPSLTVADPRCASVLGIGFNPDQIDQNHYNLYLQIYPNGNPSDEVITLPAIDVSGNQGSTPGLYTLDSIVFSTNNAFRRAGYNYRFIAFQYDGNFGICTSDPFDGISFSIVSYDFSSGTPVEGSLVKNVIGDILDDGFDALGLGKNHANYASPIYRSSFYDFTEAQFPTKIFVPRKNKSYIVDGVSRDYIKSAIGVTDGYWNATISQRIETIDSIETSYTIEGFFDSVGLAPGKTITVLPTIKPSDSPTYNNHDYGRFIIKNVVYQAACGLDTEKTIITVLNAVHGSGNPKGSSSGVTFPYQVKIYFGHDTVGFNLNHMIDGVTPVATKYHRHHEIYVTKEGKTFSHERARMPIQESSGNYLGTSNWHINYVSPKFRGYLGSVGFNKYIRFKILSYDLTSGEFTAQIGKPGSGNAILNPGQIITNRKNNSFKIYDETGVDYLELEFVETASIPSSISSDSFVDIEIFQTLSLDEELLLLSTCEMNTDSNSTYLIERVVDKRQIGSIGVKDFNQSAKNYISAVDRVVNFNGIINDLSFAGYGTEDLSYNFNGGSALINGNVVNFNNTTVNIPKVVIKDSVPGNTITWVVCVNELGDFLSLPLTENKIHLYVRDYYGVNYYFIPSYTFEEIVFDRKDLVPLYMVNYTMGNLSFNSISDVRKFVNNQSFNIPLVWCEDNKEIASFQSSEALVNWIQNIRESNNYNYSKTSLNSKIIVKGVVTLNQSVDLSLLSPTHPNLIIEGEATGSAKIIVNSDIGLIISSNTIIRNIEFFYNPVTLSPDNLIGAAYGIGTTDPAKGCISISNAVFQDGFKNILIDNCTFTSFTARRFPFIICALNYTEAYGLNIINNKFSGSGKAAIVIYNDSQNGSPISILNSVNIENNYCYYDEGIFIFRNTETNYSEEGLVLRNVNISKNKCGSIGFSCSHFDTSGSYQKDFTTSLNIFGNTCNEIVAPVLIDGNKDSAVVLGSVIISDNFCSNIDIFCSNQGTSGYSTILVKNNSLEKKQFSPYLSSYVYAIDVYGSYSYTNNGAIISNNSINFGRDSLGNSLLYDYGIKATHADVIDNFVSGFSIYGISADGATGVYNFSIRGNKLSRNGVSIDKYIYTGNQTEIIDNILDSTTVDGSDEDTITGNGLIQRNVNHIQTLQIDVREFGRNGKVNYIRGIIQEGNQYLENNSINYLSFNPLVVDGSISFSKYLPLGVRLHSLTVETMADRKSNTTGNLEILIYEPGVPVLPVTRDLTTSVSLQLDTKPYGTRLTTHGIGLLLQLEHSVSSYSIKVTINMVLKYCY